MAAAARQASAPVREPPVVCHGEDEDGASEPEDQADEAQRRHVAVAAGGVGERERP